MYIDWPLRYNLSKTFNLIKNRCNVWEAAKKNKKLKIVDNKASPPPGPCLSGQKNGCKLKKKKKTLKKFLFSLVDPLTLYLSLEASTTLLRWGMSN